MTAKNTIANFESKFIPEPMSGCWLWEAYTKNGRYGSFNWHGVQMQAHVFAYQWYLKKIVPKNKVLDHLCRNTWCVNPEHLEPITQRINSRRGKHATKTHCIQGHPYAEGFEIYKRPRGDKNGIQYRRCLTCYRLKYPGSKKENYRG